jgi:seryl-tRNA synthetase
LEILLKRPFAQWTDEEKEEYGDKQQLREKEKQLREEKKQLREKENQLRREKEQLREEKNLLLRQLPLVPSSSVPLVPHHLHPMVEGMKLS